MYTFLEVSLIITQVYKQPKYQLERYRQISIQWINTQQ